MFIGTGVFEQNRLRTVADYDYFIASAPNNLLNIDLHCIGANGAGYWRTPDGGGFSNLVTMQSDDSQSEILSDNGVTFADQEGYYECIAKNEYDTEETIHVGLFNAGKCVSYFIYALDKSSHN